MFSVGRGASSSVDRATCLDFCGAGMHCSAEIGLGYQECMASSISYVISICVISLTNWSNRFPLRVKQVFFLKFSLVATNFSVDNHYGNL